MEHDIDPQTKSKLETQRPLKTQLMQFSLGLALLITALGMIFAYQALVIYPQQRAQAFQAAIDEQCPDEHALVSDGTFYREDFETYQSWWRDKGFYCVETYGYGIDCICG